MLVQRAQGWVELRRQAGAAAAAAPAASHSLCSDAHRMQAPLDVNVNEALASFSRLIWGLRTNQACTLVSKVLLTIR